MSSGLFNGGVSKDLIDTILANQPATSGMAGPIATGQAYAQQISGGIPASQVIAPGVSYSPELPGGYTQADLNAVQIPRDVAPVFPEVPTTGEGFESTYPTMPYAPPGTPMPEPLDLSTLPSFLTGIPQFDLTGVDLSDLGIDTSQFDFSGIDASLDPFKTDIIPEDILQFREYDFPKLELPILGVTDTTTAPVMPPAPVIPETTAPTLPTTPTQEDVKKTLFPETSYEDLYVVSRDPADRDQMMDIYNQLMRDMASQYSVRDRDPNITSQQRSLLSQFVREFGVLDDPFYGSVYADLGYIDTPRPTITQPGGDIPTAFAGLTLPDNINYPGLAIPTPPAPTPTPVPNAGMPSVGIYGGPTPQPSNFDLTGYGSIFPSPTPAPAPVMPTITNIVPPAAVIPPPAVVPGLGVRPSIDSIVQPIRSGRSGGIFGF